MKLIHVLKGGYNPNRVPSGPGGGRFTSGSGGGGGSSSPTGGKKPKPSRDDREARVDDKIESLLRTGAADLRAQWEAKGSKGGEKGLDKMVEQAMNNAHQAANKKIPRALRLASRFASRTGRAPGWGDTIETVQHFARGGE